MRFLRLFTLTSCAYAATISSKATLSAPQPTVRYLNNTISPSLTASSSEACCLIVLDQVLLGEWYSLTFSTTIATVTTQFTRYNNTVVTGSTTYNASSVLPTIQPFQAYTDFPFIPEDEIRKFFGAGLVYGDIVPILGTETYVNGAGTIKSPANYVGMDFANIITTTNDDGSCRYTGQRGDMAYTSLDLYYVLPTSEVHTWEGRMPHDLGPEFPSFRPTLISRLLQLGADPEFLKTCSMIGGEGAPSLHVPMVALTEHVSQTVTSLGSFNAAPSPALEITVTSAAPLPRPTPLPAQTSVVQVAQPNPQPSAPQPPSAPSQPLPVPVPSAPQQSSLQAPPVPPQGQPLPSQGQPAPSQPAPAPSQVQPRPSQGQPAFSQGQQQPSASLLEVSQAQVPQPQGPTRLPPGTPTPASAIVLGSETVTLLVQTSSPAVVLPGDVTLKPGDVVTFSSQVLSLQSTGSALVVLGKSSTTTIPLVAPAPTDDLPATVVTIASTNVPIQYVTGTAGGVILSNGDTLLPGSATEVNGVTVSLAPSATELVVGSSTIALTGGATASTSQPGAGDFIWSGIGGGPATTSIPAQFTGGASVFSWDVSLVLAAITCAMLFVLV